MHRHNESSLAVRVRGASARFGRADAGGALAPPAGVDLLRSGFVGHRAPPPGPEEAPSSPEECSASALDVEDEGELRPAGERPQVHRPARAAVAPGAARDRERAVARVEERTGDDDL